MTIAETPPNLYRPGRLATIDAAVSRWQNAPARYPPLPATSKAFLDAAHHAARRSTRLRRGAFAILALLTALAVTASVVAVYQRAAAVRQRDQAIYSRVIAEALQYGTSNTPLAAQLTLAAYRIQPTQDLASRLLNTENTPPPTLLTAATGVVNSVAFSPRRRMLASGDATGTVRLWDVADPAHPRPLGQPLTGSATVQSVAFSPDGRTPAIGDAHGTVQLWDAAILAYPGRVPAPLQPVISSTAVGSIAFSPDGRTLAIGSLNGTIQLWDVAGRAHLRLLGQPLTGSAAVRSVAFSPDGRTLASGDGGGAVWLWNVADPAHPGPSDSP